jgi:hypothetical protein
VLSISRDELSMLISLKTNLDEMIGRLGIEIDKEIGTIAQSCGHSCESGCTGCKTTCRNGCKGCSSTQRNGCSMADDWTFDDIKFIMENFDEMAPVVFTAEFIERLKSS